MPEGPEAYQPSSETELQKRVNLAEIALPSFGDAEKGKYIKLEPKDPTDVNWQLLIKVRELIRKNFPRTGYFRDQSTQDFQAGIRQFYRDDPNALEILEREIAKHPTSTFYEFEQLKDKEEQSHQLYYIASIFKGERLDQNDPSSDIRRALQGKKILVLGDDIGSLSEMLRFYSADAYGIEYDKFKVLVAHSGVLAENGNPQNQVMEGNVGDLFDSASTSLMEKLEQIGQFDMVFSDNLFNEGSGMEELLDIPRHDPTSLWDKWESGGEKGLSPADAFQKNCDTLLNENGAQLHMRIDILGAFPESFRERMIKKFPPRAMLIPMQASENEIQIV